MQGRILWLVTGILGCVALVTLTCLGGLMALTAFFAGPLTATQTLPMVSAVVGGLVLGIPSILQGWAGWRGRPSRPFAPPRAWWLGLILLGVLLALGAVVSLRSLAPVLLLPPIHALAMVLLPLLVLWPVGRALRGRGGSWRDVLAGMTGGGFIGTMIILTGLIAFVAVIIVIAGMVEQFEELASRMEEPDWMAYIQNMLLSPAVVLATLGILSIPVPLIEESVKTLVTGVAGRWIRPAPARAFLWGVAGGAGFALVENLLGGALGGVEQWLPGVIARLGATVMHCFTGGLVGWGWGQLWTARRPWRLLGCYAAAVLAHAVWNASAVGVVFLSVGLMAQKGGVSHTFMLFGIWALLGLLILLTLVFFTALVVAGHKLAAQVERTPEQPVLSEASSL